MKHRAWPNAPQGLRSHRMLFVSGKLTTDVSQLGPVRLWLRHRHCLTHHASRGRGTERGEYNWMRAGLQHEEGVIWTRSR